jgi:hypothetical protein
VGAGFGNLSADSSLEFFIATLFYILSFIALNFWNYYAPLSIHDRNENRLQRSRLPILPILYLPCSVDNQRAINQSESILRLVAKTYMSETLQERLLML